MELRCRFCFGFHKHNAPSGANTISEFKSDISQRQMISTNHTLEGHTGGVNTVTVTADGRYVISGSGDNSLKVWDLETGKIIASFSGDSALYSCAVAPDGTTIVAGERPGQVHFLRLENAGC